MADFLTRNKLLLAKVESTPGTDAEPTVAANAIDGENWQYTLDTPPVQTNEMTGSLDGRGPLFAGGMARLTGDVLLKGSGAAGTAPDSGVLFLGCAMSETVFSSAVTGQAQAGAAGTITLASDDAGAANAYRGRVIRITSGTGSGQSRVILSNNASTKVVSVVGNWATTPDNTSNYSIDAGVLYRPASVDYDNLTLYLYQNNKDSGANSKLDKLFGGMGTFSLAVAPRQPMRATFNFQGIMPSTHADVSAPGAETVDATRPPPFVSAGSYLGTAALGFNALQLTYGAAVTMFDNPAEAFGYDVADITERRITGTINPRRVLTSARDAVADLKAGTSYPLALHWGATAGNRIALLQPALVYTGVSPGDAGGVATDNLAFEASGEDAGTFLFIS